MSSLANFGTYYRKSKMDFYLTPEHLKQFSIKTVFTECSFADINLSGCSFNACNFVDCDFSYAKLERTEFKNNTLSGCNLSETCFDPRNIPHCEEELSGIGYRTKYPVHMSGPGYDIGRSYEAPIFSTSPTPCHPGLYFYTSLETCYLNYPEHTLIEVAYSPADVHKAGSKYRVKRFKVIREISPECVAAALRELKEAPK